MDDEDVIQQLEEGLLDTFYNHVALLKAKTSVDFFEDLVLAQTAIRIDRSRNVPATGPVRNPSEKSSRPGRKFVKGHI